MRNGSGRKSPMQDHMRAAPLAGRRSVRGLTIACIPKPVPTPNEVLVRVLISPGRATCPLSLLDDRVDVELATLRLLLARSQCPFSTGGGDGSGNAALPIPNVVGV